MPWNGSFGSRWRSIAIVAGVASGVLVACGDKSGEELFQDAGGGGRRGSGGGAVSGSGGSSGSVNSGTGGQGTGGSKVSGGSGGTTGGAAPATGGKVSGSGGAVTASGGKTSSGGTSQGGTNASGGISAAGSNGGDVAVAGSDQGGSSSTEGGAPDSAGSGGDAAAGAAGAAEGSRTIQIGDLLDTYVDACNENDNHGSDGTLSVDSDPCVFEIYIKPPSLSDIPSGATVESALLELQCTDAGNTVQVRTITDEWSEESVDWESRPGTGDEIGSFLPADGPVVIDVTSLVQEWLTGTSINGVALVQIETETDGSDYHSSESGEAGAPRLLVTYTP